MLDLVKLRRVFDAKIQEEYEDRKRLEEEEKKGKKEKKGKEEKRHKEYIKICDRYDRPVLEIMKRLKKDWYRKGRVIKTSGWLREYSLKIPRYIPPIYVGNSNIVEEEYAKISIVFDWKNYHERLFFEINLLLLEENRYCQHNEFTFNYDREYIGNDSDSEAFDVIDLDIEKLKALIDGIFEQVYGDLIHKEGI